jgi:hypothetical protein
VDPGDADLPAHSGSTIVGRAAERVARTVDRKSFLKKALVTAVTVTYLDKIASPALAGNGGGPYYIGSGPSSLTDRLSITAIGCWSGSQACYVFGAQSSPAVPPQCGCENACCYEPAHSGRPCLRRNNSYCWTCNSGTYVCCDYWCYGNPCHCGSPCSYNQCGTGKC